mmetsp:Transcript_2257/g.5277  ORF Transcript_2257/g.5277 Transcript_2257/m.5277 type:complete len:241 (+) Transcript_2257:1528-2250(+)
MRRVDHVCLRAPARRSQHFLLLPHPQLLSPLPADCADKDSSEDLAESVELAARTIRCRLVHPRTRMRGGPRDVLLCPRGCALRRLDPQPLLRLSLQALLRCRPRRHLLDRRQAAISSRSSDPPASRPRSSLRSCHLACLLRLGRSSAPSARCADLSHRLPPPSPALAAVCLLLLLLLRRGLLQAACPLSLLLLAARAAPGLAGVRLGRRRAAAGAAGGDDSLRATAGAGERLRALCFQGA